MGSSWCKLGWLELGGDPAALCVARNVPNVATLLPQCGPNVAPRLPHVSPKVAPTLPQCGKNVAPMWPQCCPIVAPMWPQCCPSVAPMLPQCGPNVAPMGHQCCHQAVGSVARNCWAEARKNCEKRAKLRTGQRPKASKAQSWATPKSEQSSEAGNAQKRAKLRSGQRPKASQAQKWAMPKLRNELPCSRSKPGKPRCFNMTRKNTPLKTNIINAVETRRATFGPHWGNIGATLAQHWGNIEEH